MKFLKEKIEINHYLILIIDDERSTLLNATTVPHLALASPESLGLVHLFNISISLDLLQENVGFLGLVVGLDLVRNDQGDLGDLLDAVTFGHNEGRHTSGSDGWDHSVPLLGYIHLPVPATIDLGGSEHMSTTAHVSESTLTGTVGTATTDTWDTCNSSSSSPRLGTCLVTCQLKQNRFKTFSMCSQSNCFQTVCTRALPRFHYAKKWGHNANPQDNVAPVKDRFGQRNDQTEDILRCTRSKITLLVISDKPSSLIFPKKNCETAWVQKVQFHFTIFS